MAKFIQICASENDLFGLDGEGVVYQYNFKTRRWTELGHAQPDDDRVVALRTEGDQPDSGHARSRASSIDRRS